MRVRVVDADMPRPVGRRVLADRLGRLRREPMRLGKFQRQFALAATPAVPLGVGEALLDELMMRVKAGVAFIAEFRRPVTL